RTETFLIDGQPAPIDEAARLWQEHVLEQKSAILRRPSGIDRATLRLGDGVIEYERIIEND
ncbi:MAG: hypothetical protein O7B99_10300, partial [Planctomycetota bacterium]|nr:hypothetical protein [Planctomycetota bacterium]